MNRFSLSFVKGFRSLLIVTLVVLCASPLQLAWAYTPQTLYDEVWQLINTRYLDETKNGQDWRIWRHRYDSQLKTDKDAYVAIESMLASLDDRFTRFLPPDEFAEEGRSIKATLFGIGIQIGIRDAKLLVIAPIEDTPAARAGLKPNDAILEIDGKSTQGISVKDAADLIRGEKGTTVNLLIQREGEGKPKIVKVMRDEIKLKSVSAKHPFEVQMPDEVGYIKLSTFLSSSAAKELLDAIKAAKDKQAYVIDVRSNPGGLLTNAILIADFFLEDGGIVSTVDRDGYKESRQSGEEVLTEKPLAILIDEGSASASEILSGALKDNNRAILVGQRTFGKGLVQEINQLPGGAGINITTQKYLTPKDIDINKKGIEPDIEVKITKDDVEAKRDPQLEKAVEALGDKLGLELTVGYKASEEPTAKDKKGKAGKAEPKPAKKQTTKTPAAEKKAEPAKLEQESTGESQDIRNEDKPVSEEESLKKNENQDAQQANPDTVLEEKPQAPPSSSSSEKKTPDNAGDAGNSAVTPAKKGK